MKIYRLSAINGWIFGQIEPSNEYVESKLVPYEQAKTYGDKRGISHIDIFGYNPFESEFTWICIEGVVNWYAEPPKELRHPVEDHLFRKYGLNNVKHVWPS